MKFLVIQTRDIGDVMLSTALCNTLKLNYPDAAVHMLTMDFCAGVVEGNPHIDEIIVLEKKKRSNFLYVWNFLRKIKSRKYDVIINVQGQLTGLLCCLCSLSSKRIGFNHFFWRLAHTDKMAFPCPHPHSGEGYTIDDRFTLLDALDIKQKNLTYRLWLNREERETAEKYLLQSGINLNRPIIALGINSRDDYKQWPIHYFAKIADWLIEQYHAQIYVFFGPGEESYSHQLKALIPEKHRHNIFDDIKTRSIRELAAFFSHCDLYVGNDTGPRHIAQALNLPAFAIVSPASNKRGWIPWNNPRFRAVDTADALGLSTSEWNNICKKLTPGVNDAEWFLKLDVDFVQHQLTNMINELGLFSRQK